MAKRWQWSVMVRVLVLSMVALAGGAVEGGAQETGRVRVFLDCQTNGCPATEFRTEIPFVDWVRERTAADLHVIVTGQNSGGGTQYVFDLVGRNDFEDATLRVTADVSDTATRDERLGTLTRTFKAALAPYEARRGYADQLEITSRDAAGMAATSRDQNDPWRRWVFSVGAEGWASGEEQQSERRVGARFNANRTTPDWKVDLGMGGSYSQEEFELSEGTFVSETDAWELQALVVRSLTPHWSAGGELGVNTSTSLNRKVGGRVAAALEWNYFPYEEANRRQLLLHYQVGYSHFRYEEETIFGRLEESKFDHRLAAGWQMREPWGDGSLAVIFGNFLDDWSQYRLSVGGDLRVRLIRGLEAYIWGGYDLIRDQIYLPAEELDDEEILVQRRQLATGYEYHVQVGLSYRFGSIYNNVVNNRFPWLVRNF